MWDGYLCGFKGYFQVDKIEQVIFKVILKGYYLKAPKLMEN